MNSYKVSYELYNISNGAIIGNFETLYTLHDFINRNQLNYSNLEINLIEYKSNTQLTIERREYLIDILLNE